MVDHVSGTTFGWVPRILTITWSHPLAWVWNFPKYMFENMNFIFMHFVIHLPFGLKKFLFVCYGPIQRWNENMGAMFLLKNSISCVVINLCWEKSPNYNCNHGLGLGCCYHMCNYVMLTLIYFIYKKLVVSWSIKKGNKTYYYS